MNHLKKLILATLLVMPVLGFAAPRAIELETKSIDGAVHWVPAKVEIHPGEEIEITAKHNLVGGFDFHGLTISALGVSETVNRNVPKVIKLKVPADLKAGDYAISCQFHPKHVPAKLVVKKK